MSNPVPHNIDVFEYKSDLCASKGKLVGHHNGTQKLTKNDQMLS